MVVRERALTQGAIRHLTGGLIFGVLLIGMLITLVAKAADIFEGVPSHLIPLFAKYRVLPSDNVTVQLGSEKFTAGQVPIKVTSSIKGAKSIVLIVPGNDQPLAAVFNLADSQVKSVQTHLRLKESGDILALVQTDDQLFGSFTYIKLQ